MYPTQMYACNRIVDHVKETSIIWHGKTSFAVYHFVYLVDCIYKTGLVDKEEIQLTTHDFID